MTYLSRIGRAGVGAWVIALALSACARPDGDERQAAQPAPQQPASLPAGGAIPQQPFAPGAPTGTFVGAKVLQLRGDLENMQRGLAVHSDRLAEIQGSTAQHAGSYHGLVADINSRLLLGTTPGNPILTSQLGQAQGELARIDADLAQLSELAGRVSTDSALAGYLLEAVRAAYNLSGAVEEDHRQLALLEDEVNRTVVLVDRLLSEINTDVTRQTANVGNERRDLQTLALAVKKGEPYGANLSLASATSRRAVSTAGRPLVVIRFDRPTVEYEQPLYRAISEALERRPSSSFLVEAAAPPSAGSPASARRQADRVVRTLIEMGVPRERIDSSDRLAGDALADEVRIYVR